MPDEPLPALPPSQAQLVELSALFQAGRYLDAHAICQTLAPLETWNEVDALVIGGRLASQWGHSQFSNRLHQRAHRKDPTHLFAAYYRGLITWNKHGAFESLQFVRRIIPVLPAAPETGPQAYLWMLYARLLGSFRDFTAAEPIVDRVLQAQARDPWLWVDKADFLEGQDRYTEALAATAEAIRIQPWYRPAICAQAHLLHLLERDEDAIRLLRDSLDHLQSAAVVQMLVGMLEEHDRLHEIPSLLDLTSRYLPLADAAHQLWLSSRRCMVGHRLGDAAGALEWARKCDSAYYKVIAEKISAPKAPPRRVQLPVGFVRQHHMTCAPATLTALSQFWGVPADHFEIARQICYDGSPDHVERDWAEKSGWVVREFRPTWETACGLLDRGCPFSVVTVETDSAHMQAVIGYDRQLETLLVRDPFVRLFREWIAPNFFTAYAAHGPRAMLMIPADKASLLDGLALPETELYDGLYQLRRALHRHDRSAGEAALAILRRIDESHLLSLWAALELAQYDGRLSDGLETVRRIREKHPADNNWRLVELRLRERLGDQVEHRKLLHESGSARGALRAIRRDYAEDLARDARQHGRARRILRSLLRQESSEPRNLRAYANLLWKMREFEDALLLYRLAACRADKVEYHWDSYFIACRHLDQTDEALALLRSRVSRWGAQSSQPARTLFDSLNALDRTDEGFVLLEEACRQRPDDGELLLFTAEAMCRYGRFEESTQLLEAARTREGRLPWLRTAARIADYRRDHPAALKHWRELAALSPADSTAHATIARLLAVTEGEASAIAHLRAACEACPRSVPLYQTLVQRLRDAPAVEALAAVEQLLAIDPADSWTLREKALILRRLRRLDDALACADEAVHIAPNVPSSHGVRADILADLGRTEEAHAGYHAGLRLSIDADWLFEPLLALCTDFAARRAAVTFLHRELMQQNSLEHACLQFRATARAVVSGAELAEMLLEYHRANPEIWASWSALIIHLLETNQLEEARQLAQTATERFPLVPRAWTDLARVHAQAGETRAEIAAVQHALAINPGWGQASRQLSTAYEHLLQLDQAEHVLRRAVAASPLEAANHGWLADVLWRLKRPIDALASIETALTLSPDYSWAWERLDGWSREQGDPRKARELARKFTESRAGEASSWLRLVRMCYNDPDPAENLRALDRAAQLTPLDTEVWDLRACLLADKLRYDEALDACRPAVFGEKTPYVLTGRAAWIEHRRGRVKEAIDLLKAIVDVHPDYRWGWSNLTEWYWENDRLDDVLIAAEKWAWLDPNSAPPHGYLALTHQKANRRKDAKASLARAMLLDPLYGFGAAELLKMHLADSEFDAARQVLKHYEAHYSVWEALRAEIRLHIAAKDRAAALITLSRFGSLPTAASDVFENTAELLFEAGWPEVVENACAPLLTATTALPVVGTVWIRSRKRKQQVWTTFWRLIWLKAAPAQRLTVLADFIAWLGEKELKWTLRLALVRWGRELRKDAHGWGQVGYALTTCRLFRRTTRWMRGWDSRPEPPAPWMLSNLVLSYQSLGQPDHALGVLGPALALPPDHVQEKLLGWRAIEHALRGEAGPAVQLLEKINHAEAPPFHQSILLLTRVVTEVQLASPSERPAKVASVLTRLREHSREHPNLISDLALRRLYRRAMDRLGREAGRPWLRIRSRLPLFVPGIATQNLSGNSAWATFLAFVALSTLLRSCADLADR